MSTVKRFEELECWILARQLCKQVGQLLDSGCFKNNFKLINQVEGSAGSIMDNIAEGFERGSRSEFILFLSYSKGSCGELRSQLYRALDREYLTRDQFDQLFNLCEHISGKLQRFIRYLLRTGIAGERKNKI